MDDLSGQGPEVDAERRAVADGEKLTPSAAEFTPKQTPEERAAIRAAFTPDRPRGEPGSSSTLGDWHKSENPMSGETLPKEDKPVVPEVSPPQPSSIEARIAELEYRGNRDVGTLPADLVQALKDETVLLEQYKTLKARVISLGVIGSTTPEIFARWERQSPEIMKKLYEGEGAPAPEAQINLDTKLTDLRRVIANLNSEISSVNAEISEANNPQLQVATESLESAAKEYIDLLVSRGTTEVEARSTVEALIKSFPALKDVNIQEPDKEPEQKVEKEAVSEEQEAVISLFAELFASSKENILVPIVSESTLEADKVKAAYDNNTLQKIAALKTALANLDDAAKRQLLLSPQYRDLIDGFAARLVATKKEYDQEQAEIKKMEDYKNRTDLNPSEQAEYDNLLRENVSRIGNRRFSNMNLSRIDNLVNLQKVILGRTSLEQNSIDSANGSLDEVLVAYFIAKQKR